MRRKGPDSQGVISLLKKRKNVQASEIQQQNAEMFRGVDGHMSSNNVSGWKPEGERISSKKRHFPPVSSAVGFTWGREAIIILELSRRNAFSAGGFGRSSEIRLCCGRRLEVETGLGCAHCPGAASRRVGATCHIESLKAKQPKDWLNQDECDSTFQERFGTFWAPRKPPRGPCLASAVPRSYQRAGVFDRARSGWVVGDS